MTTTRDLADLDPPVEPLFRQFLAQCAADPWLRGAGLAVLVTCVWRSRQAQTELYAQGRTQAALDAVGLRNVRARPGRRVTWALPGQSKHNRTDPRGQPASHAIDIVPLRHGKPVWGTSGDGVDANPADDMTDDLEAWQVIGAIGKRCGLAWAGDWPKETREFPHFEAP